MLSARGARLARGERGLWRCTACVCETICNTKTNMYALVRGRSQNAYRVLVGKELLLKECVGRGGGHTGGWALQHLAGLGILDQRPDLRHVVVAVLHYQICCNAMHTSFWHSGMESHCRKRLSSCSLAQGSFGRPPSRWWPIEWWVCVQLSER